MQFNANDWRRLSQRQSTTTWPGLAGAGAAVNALVMPVLAVGLQRGGTGPRSSIDSTTDAVRDDVSIKLICKANASSGRDCQQTPRVAATS
jgi:hypothetical protein